ncbi:antitoxin [Marinospirillum sp.]|uniref:AbrB/MazE/SpoVT family DNA-binding domain-containing protein n=1 Tax=Marinospirillum sp. TaxID=2183934 RepID=UPI00286FD73D|nr:antitoxin [Marinospirillum sp.]MDR9467825.1 antitoxin [Marinospirillum sp.]
MHTTHLRKVGGSVMLPVPPALLSVLHLEAGSSVGLDIEAGHLIVHSQTQPEYTLEQLLSQCDFSVPVSTEDQVWMDDVPQGNELI